MSCFGMVVAIVAIVMFAKVLRARNGGGDNEGGRRRNRRDGFGDGPPRDPDAERLRDEVRALKERIAVLERIATDNAGSASALDREIESLRSRP